jgi:hypothetical protein
MKKITMKKSITILGLLFLLVTILSSCGGASDSDSDSSSEIDESLILLKKTLHGKIHLL